MLAPNTDKSIESSKVFVLTEFTETENKYRAGEGSMNQDDCT